MRVEIEFNEEEIEITERMAEDIRNGKYENK
jgi:hypothetical protein